jgi:hypothetical protein
MQHRLFLRCWHPVDADTCQRPHLGAPLWLHFPPPMLPCVALAALRVDLRLGLSCRLFRLSASFPGRYKVGKRALYPPKRPELDPACARLALDRRCLPAGPMEADQGS